MGNSNEIRNIGGTPTLTLNDFITMQNGSGGQPTPSVNDMFNANATRGVGRPAIPMSSFYTGPRFDASLPFTDAEEMAAQQQSAWDKWGNGLGKMLGTTTSSFVGGTVGTLVGMGEAALGGGLSKIFDNEVYRGLDQFNRYLEDALPNYYKKSEMDADWYAPENILSANFFSDKIFKNMGYSIGAIAGGAAWAAVLRNIGLTNRLVQAGRGLETVEAVESAITSVPRNRRFGAISETLSSAAQNYLVQPLASGLKNSDRIITAFMGTMGEASIESLQNLNDTRTKLIDDFVKTNGYYPVGADLDEINETATNVGKFTWGMNVGLLTATNYVQLPKILSSSKTAERLQMNAIQAEVGSPVSKFAAAPSVLERYGKAPGRFIDRYLVKPSSLLFSPVEAFEEGTQFAIQTGVQDYFNRAYQNKKDVQDFFSTLSGTLKNVFTEGMEQTLNSKEGMESILIGGVSGGLMTSFSPFGENTLKERGLTGQGGIRKANTDAALAALNNNTATKTLKDGAKYVGIAINSQKLRQNAIAANDILSEKDYEKDYELSYIMPRVKYGKLDSVFQDTSYYRQQALTESGFNELKTEQIVHQDEKREKFLSRLANLEETAVKADQHFKMLNDKYSTIVDQKGTRVYSDSTIEKMVYAMSKINDYDKRVVELQTKLESNGISITPLRDSFVTSAKFREAFALKELAEDADVVAKTEKILSDINEMDTTSVIKDNFKQDVADFAEMVMRRKLFIDEYNSIREKPFKYDSEPKKDVTPEVAPPQDKPTEEAKEKVKVKSGGKELEYNIGETYIVFNPFELDKKGKKVSRSKQVKLLAVNDDNTVQIENQEGKILTITKDTLLDYKLGKANLLKDSPTANFYYTYINSPFQFNFGRKYGGIKIGKLAYDPQEDKLYFEYRKKKKDKELTLKELNRGFFIAQEGFDKAKIEAIGTSTQEQLNAFEDYVDAQAWLEEQAIVKKSERHITRALEDLFYDTQDVLDDVYQKIIDKGLELEQINKEIQEQKKIIKAEEKAKARFSTAFNKANKALVRLGNLKEDTEKSIEELDEQREEYEFNLTYIEEFAGNLKDLPETFEEFKKEYDKQVKWVKDMLDLTENADKALKNLSKGTTSAIKDVISFMKDIFNKYDKDYPAYISEAFESILKSANVVANIPTIKQYLTDFALTQDLAKDVTLNERELEKVDKALKNVIEQVKELNKEYKAMQEIQSQFRTQAKKFRQAREEEEELAKDQDLLDIFFKYQKKLEGKSALATDEPMTDEQLEKANKNISTAKKPVQIAYHSTIVSSSSDRPSDIRHNIFMDNIDFMDPADRANLRRVYVTKYNEEAFNLKGIIKKHATNSDGSVFTPKNEDEEIILAVYAYKDPETGRLYFINELGEKTDYELASPDLEDVTKTNLDEIVWAAMPSGSPTTPDYGYRYDVDKTDPQQAREFLDAWVEERAEILSLIGADSLIEEPFLVSNGVLKTEPTKKGKQEETKRRKIVGTLISRDQLDSKAPYIVVSTKGSIVHQNRVVPMEKGRVAVQNGGTLRIVNTGNLNKEQVDTAFAVLKEFVRKANAERTFDNNYLKYLQGILHFESPYKKKDDEVVKNENIGRNQFYFHKGRLYFGKNEVFIPFTVNALETEERAVKAFLKGAYHNVNNTFIKNNDPFTEYTTDKDGNPVVKKEWKSYQHYLISDEGRTNEEIPLFTNVVPRVPDVYGDSIFEPGSRYTYVYEGEPIVITPFEEAAGETAEKPEQSREELRLGRRRVQENVQGDEGTMEVFGRQKKKNPLPTSPASTSGGSRGATKVIETPEGKFVLWVSPEAQAERDEIRGLLGGRQGMEKIDDDDVQDLAEDNRLRNQYPKGKPGGKAKNRVVVTYNYALAELDKERKYIEERSPFTVEEIKGLIKAGNGIYSFGSYLNSVIKLSDVMEVGTGYHEFFHGIWDVFTDYNEKLRLLKEFKSRDGSFTDRETGKVVQYKDAHDIQAIEQMAEEFRDYKLYNISPPKAKEQTGILGWFKKLLKWIKFALNPKQVKDLNDLFGRMDSAYYKNARYKSVPSTENMFRRQIGSLDVRDSHTVVMHVVGKVIEDLALTDIKALNELDFSTLKALKASSIFGKIKDELATYFYDVKERYKAKNKNLTDEEITNKLDIVKDNILNNWPLVESFVREVLKTYKVVQEIDVNYEGLNTDYGGRNSESYLADTFTIDGKRTAPASIKLLLVTLQEMDWATKKRFKSAASLRDPNALMDEVVPRIDDSTGLQTLVNFANLYNTLVEELVTENTLEQKTKKIKQLAKKNPTMNMLYKRLRLNYTNTLGIEDWALRIKFANTFSRMAPEPLAMYLSDNGVVSIERADLFSSVEMVKSNWLGNLKNSGIVKYRRPYNKPEARGNYQLKVDELINIPTATGNSAVDSAGVFRFLDALGLGLGENQDRISLNEFNGNYAKLANAVSSIKYAFRKNAKSYEGDKGLYVNANTIRALEINKPLSDIFAVKFEVDDLSPESSYMNFDRNRVQKHVQTNAISRIINDINSATSRKELVNEVLPHLGGLYSQDSVYLNSEIFSPQGNGKKINNVLSIKYTTGVYDKKIKEGIPTSKLSKGLRLMMAINQNLKGNYYILMPADGQTEWMISMLNIFNKLDKATIDQFFEYYQTEQSLKGKSRNRLFSFLEDKLSRKSFERDFTKFVEEEVDIQFQQLRDYGLIFGGEKEGTFNFPYLEDKWAEANKYKKEALSEAQVREILTTRTLNFMGNNTEIHKLFFGDPARYKDPTKRYKSFLSPREQSFYDSEEFDDIANSTWNTIDGVKLEQGDPGYIEYSPNMKTITWSDVEVTIPELPGYEQVNSTDGQGAAPLVGYKQMRIKNGYRWSEADEKQFQYEVAMDRLLMEEDGMYEYTDDTLRKHDEKLRKAGDPVSAVFTPLKPVATGFYTDDSGDDNPILDKFSIYGFTYRAVRGSHMANEYVRMLKNGLSYGVFESGRKVGAKAMENMYAEDGNIKDVDEPYNEKAIVNVPFKWFGIQVETAGVKYSQTIGSQLSKLATLNLLNNGVPIDWDKGYDSWMVMPEAKKRKMSKIYDLVARESELRGALVEQGYQELLDKVGMTVSADRQTFTVNSKKLLDSILDELTRRDLNENLREALKIKPDQNEFEIPLEALNNYEQIKSIIFSYVDKYIASPKVNGGPKIQVSGAGFMVSGKRVKSKEITTKDGKKKSIFVSSGLKFYENKDGKRYMEVLLPNWFARKLAKAGIDPETINLKDLDDDILTGVGFRIPTQELNSVEVFKVAGFLPESMGDTVVVPEAITTKAGSDFDVDKLNTYLKNIYIDENKNVKAVPYKTGAEAESFFGDLFDQRLKRKVESVEKQLEFKSKLLEAAQTMSEDLQETQRMSKFIEKHADLLNSMLEGLNTPEALNEAAQEIIDSMKTLGNKQEALTDAGLQKEMKRRYVSRMTRQSIENEYFRTLENILSREENFKRLTTPNSSKELMDLRDKLAAISEEEFGAGRVNSVLSPTFMNNLRHNYIMSKQGGVGIAANNQVNSALMQKGAVVVDPERISKLKDVNERFFIGDAKVNLPSTKVKIRGNEYNTLSGIVDAVGRYISDKVSQYINGFVDIAKDRFLVQLGVNYSNAGTYLLLEKLGVPTDVVIMFMNQPIIRELHKELDKQNKRYVFNGDIIERVRKMFPAATKVTKFEGSEKESMEEFSKDATSQLQGVIEKYYGKGKKSLNNQDNALQQFVLNEYLKYAVMQRNLFRITQSSNFDTANLSNPYLIKRKFEMAKEVETNNIFANVGAATEKTYLNKIKNRLMDAAEDVADGYFKFLNIDNIKYFEPIIEDFAKRRMFVSDEDYINMARKVEQSFISYLIQNAHDPLIGGTFNKDIYPLLVSTKDSVAVQINEAKRKMALDDTKRYSRLANNPILKMLVTEDTLDSIDTKVVKLFNKSSDVFSQNTYIAAMEELRESTVFRPLYDDLVKLAFLQSGIAYSNLSFTDIIPIEDYKRYLMPALDLVMKNGNQDLLRSFMSSDSFYRNNWTDLDIVPRIKQEFKESDTYGVVPKKTYMSPALRKFIDNLADRFKGTEAEKDAIKGMPVYRVYQRSREFGNKYITMALREHDYKLALLRRVEHEDGTPWLDYFESKETGEKVFYSVYVAVNAWGDGVKAQEHYPYGRRSVLNNGTVKMPVEPSNEALIAALGDEKKKEEKGFIATDSKQSKKSEEKKEANDVYAKIGKKTLSKNVKIVDSPNDYLKDQYAGKAVVAYRGAPEAKSFGNPFMEKGKTTKENVIAFIDFVLNSDKPQAKWIREQLESGKYKGKPIYYGNTAAAKANEPAHATALDYLINEYNWEKKQDVSAGKETFKLRDDNKYTRSQINRAMLRKMGYSESGVGRVLRQICK